MMRKLAICAALLILVMLSGMSFGQSAELLRNPGFEQPYLEGPDGPVAEGWSAWYVGAESDRPEYLAAPIDRTIGGDAQMYTSFLAVHEAGLYQSVSGLTPGVMLTFSANVWVWSTRDDLDPAVSVDPGNVTIEVGIDTSGSVNPEGSTIIWSAPVEAYDAFNKIEVSAAPAGEVATVFVKTTVGEARLVTDVYVDNASLLAAEVAAITPEVPVDATAVVDQATQEGTAPTEVPAAATAEPAAATEESATVPTEVAFLSTIEHIVQPGDSYDLIARIYGSSVSAIKEANGVSFEDNLIYPGDKLIVPVPVPAVPTSDSATAPTEAAPVPTEVPSTTEEPTSEPTAEPTSAPEETATEVATAVVILETTYTVQRGDTLMDIAKRFGTDVFELGRLNNILNYNLIRAGQVLKLPVTSTEEDVATEEPTDAPEVIRHFVQFGDSLYRIAARYGVTAQAIIEANNLENPNRIYYGQILIIPK